ncbi:MAG: hypothetical protein ACPGJJ_00175, partial [Parvibaculales bacterium]
MTNRILTTHVGSLPRSKPVTDLVFEHENGEIADWDAFNATIADAEGMGTARTFSRARFALWESESRGAR